MRNCPNLRVEKHRTDGPPNTNSGFFVFTHRMSEIRVQASDGYGWDHVSVSLRSRCPTWEEMCIVKEMFFREDEWVIQYHPAVSDYVNFHPYCLHLWRPQTEDEMRVIREAWGDEWDESWCSPGTLPIPESMLVGPKMNDGHAEPSIDDSVVGYDSVVDDIVKKEGIYIKPSKRETNG